MNTWTTAQQILTPNQLTALQLRDKGLSYRTIALHLNISPQRAHQLVNRALQKLEQHQRTETVA
jgi:DNA-binding NarL/FixJ family response regulator